MKSFDSQQFKKFLNDTYWSVTEILESPKMKEDQLCGHALKFIYTSEYWLCMTISYKIQDKKVLDSLEAVELKGFKSSASDAELKSIIDASSLREIDYAWLSQYL